MEENDRIFIERLCEQAPDLATAVDIARRLARLLKRKLEETLEGLFVDAEKTPLSRFADHLRRDIKAVENTIAMPWSTSPVEGQISRLKMIKRQMFGRAGFELLRHRVVNTS